MYSVQKGKRQTKTTVWIKKTKDVKKNARMAGFQKELTRLINKYSQQGLRRKRG